MNRTSPKARAIIVLVLILIGGFGIYYSLNIKTQTSNQTNVLHIDLTGISLKSTSIITATPIALNDTNWSGYIAASDLQNPQPTVTGISASWTVPKIKASSQRDTFSAVWIGIGGFFDNTLIQVGTEQDDIGGLGNYTVWYEFLPEFSIIIDTGRLIDLYYPDLKSKKNG